LELAQQVTSARRRVIGLALATVAGLGIRVFGIMEVMGFCSAENLIVEVAGGLVSTFPFQPIFKELNQPVDQPLLPAYDVQATLVTVLLENLVQTALQISHRLTPEGGFSEILLRPPRPNKLSPRTQAL
jgi:hypothetical protein